MGMSVGAFGILPLSPLAIPDRLQSSLFTEQKEFLPMSDIARKVIALAILIIGALLLWKGRHSYTDAEDAKSVMDSTIAYARERAASSDPRLKGAYSFERGGWGYVHLEGDPGSIGLP